MTSEVKKILQQTPKKRPARPPIVQKKGNGEGSVYLDKSKGRWIAAVPIGRTGGGKIKVRKISADTRGEALALLRQLHSQKLENRLVDPSKLTLRDMCTRWLEQRLLIRASTRERSEQHLQYVTEVLGDRKIQSIKTDDIVKLINQLSCKRMAHGGVMAPISLKHIKTQLWGVFEYAVEEGVIRQNPITRRVKLGGVEVVGGRPLTNSQVDRLHDVGEAFHAAGLLKLWPAIATALWTGMRRAETFALVWDDVDLDKAEVHVRHSLTRVNTAYVLDAPKTQSSIRKVPLHDSLIPVLQTHLQEQQRQFKKDGMPWSRKTPVFATKNGKFTSPDNLHRSLTILINWSDPAKLIRTPGEPYIWHGVKVDRRKQLMAIVKRGEVLPRISPHDLRHSYATLMLRAGMKLEVVSKLLGHADPVMTLRVYRKVGEDELDSARSVNLRAKKARKKRRQ